MMGSAYLMTANSVVNPLLYAAVNDDFKLAFRWEPFNIQHNQVSSLQVVDQSPAPLVLQSEALLSEHFPIVFNAWRCQTHTVNAAHYTTGMGTKSHDESNMRVILSLSRDPTFPAQSLRLSRSLKTKFNSFIYFFHYYWKATNSWSE